VLNDISPRLTISPTTSVAEIKTAMDDRKNQLLVEYNTNFSALTIETRLNHWKAILENSISTGWTKEAREYFIGKRMLKEIQNWLFGTKNILLWEHIINSEDENCLETCKELREILNAI
jgi:hypothetical protein